MVKQENEETEKMMNSIRKLIKEGANLSAKDGDGQTALHIAASRGLEEVMDMLVKEADMDINTPNSSGETALHLAVKNAIGKKVAATCLELGADANAIDSEGSTVLHAAAKSGVSAETVDILLSRGANPKIMDGQGRFPLQAALEADQCNIAAVASLINDGRSKLHTSNQFAKTILHLAAERGYSDIVKLLLDKKVDPDKRDNEGKTPLFLAVERQDERTTKELAQKKARDWGSDIVGRSTIYFAAKYDMNRDFFKIIGAEENDIHKQILVGKMFLRDPGVLIAHSSCKACVFQRLG